MKPSPDTEGIIDVWIDAPGGRLGMALAAHPQLHVTDPGSARLWVWARLFTADDANWALQQISQHSGDRRFIVISSMAERQYDRWGSAEPEDWSDEPWPSDSYGRGKRAARERMQGQVDEVLGLLLPAMLTYDAGERGWAAVGDAAVDGIAACPGQGAQQTGAITWADAAAVIHGLARRSWPRPALQVGSPTPSHVGELFDAFVHGAGLAGWRPHPNNNHRWPLSPVDEVCDAKALHELLPTLAWRDPRQVCEEFGQRWRHSAKDR